MYRIRTQNSLPHSIDVSSTLPSPQQKHMQHHLFSYSCNNNETPKKYFASHTVRHVLEHSQRPPSAVGPALHVLDLQCAALQPIHTRFLDMPHWHDADCKEISFR